MESDFTCAGLESTRIKKLNDKELDSNQKYVLYLMQHGQRTEHNPALEYAIRVANHLNKPLIVAFGLMEDYPEANLRHFHFMLEGLCEVQEELRKREIKFILKKACPKDLAIELSKEACQLTVDKGYLRHLRKWRSEIAGKVSIRVDEIEGELCVPVEDASDKREYAARTIRPKIRKKLHKYTSLVSFNKINNSSLQLEIKGEKFSKPEDLTKDLKCDKSVKPVTLHKGGNSSAKKLLSTFLQSTLPEYEENRNQPQSEYVSHMSKYLHYGQISPLYILLRTEESKNADADQKASFLEELVIRRELAFNFVYYCKNYDSLNCLADWAKETLNNHKEDIRDKVYTTKELENSETDDPYWNAAMKELKYAGYMHNHMRMYWGKRIIAYTSTPEYAYQTTLQLNNKYFLDGCDPNSYSNVMWLFGNHDRGWTERDVFGKVRIMTKKGLEGKCKAKGYIERVQEKIGELYQ